MSPDPDPTPKSITWGALITALARAAQKTPSGTEILGECLELAEMLIGKNARYGDSALNPVRVFSKADNMEQIRVRLDDKISRLAQGLDGEDEDVSADLMGYLVLLRIAEKRAAHGQIQHRDGAGDHRGLRGGGGDGSGSRGRVEAHEAAPDENVERPGAGGGRRDPTSAGAGLRSQLHVPGFGYVTDLRDAPSDGLLKDPKEGFCSHGVNMRAVCPVCDQGRPVCVVCGSHKTRRTETIGTATSAYTCLDCKARTTGPLGPLESVETANKLFQSETAEHDAAVAEMTDPEPVGTLGAPAGHQGPENLVAAEQYLQGAVSFEPTEEDLIQRSHLAKAKYEGFMCPRCRKELPLKGKSACEECLAKTEPMDASRPLTESEAVNPDPVRAFAPEDAFEPMGAEELVAHGVIGPELGALLGPESHPAEGSVSVEFVPIESPGEEDQATSQVSPIVSNEELKAFMPVTPEEDDDPHMTATWASDPHMLLVHCTGCQWTEAKCTCEDGFKSRFEDYDCQRCEKTKPLKGKAICEGCLDKTRGKSGGKIAERTSEGIVRRS